MVGQATKSEAHAKGLLHRTVISEVIDSQEQFLLVRQAPHKQDFGQLVSPMGGHVMSGETEEDALKRETLEELGIKEFEFKLKGKIIYKRDVKDHVENHYFIVFEIYSDQEPVLDEESVEYVRYSKDELKRELSQNPQNFGAAFLFLTKNLYPELYSRV